MAATRRPARLAEDAARSPYQGRPPQFPHENPANPGQSAGRRWSRIGLGRRPPRLHAFGLGVGRRADRLRFLPPHSRTKVGPMPAPERCGTMARVAQGDRHVVRGHAKPLPASTWDTHIGGDEGFRLIQYRSAHAPILSQALPLTSCDQWDNALKLKQYRRGVDYPPPVAYNFVRSLCVYSTKDKRP